jgi:hypothetical protein
MIYIQPIGLGLKYYIYFIYFILLNNIFLSLTKIIFINLSVQNKIKELIGKILNFYIKIFFIYPNYLLRKLNVLFKEILDISNNRINLSINELIVVEPLKLIEKRFDDESKNFSFIYGNNKLLDHIHLFKALFVALELEPEFKKIGKKIMIVSIAKEDQTFFIHKNIVIDENTTINEYLDKIKNNIQNFYESGYPLTTFNILEVKL